MRMRSDRSCLMIIDVQEALAPVMAEPRHVYRNCGLLLRAAQRLTIPTVFNEQYPKGLGHTVQELRDLAPQAPVLEKIHFSAADDHATLAHLRGLERPHIVMAGIEAHICVLQSALGLAEAGWSVFVVNDACSSRQLDDQRLAMTRLTAAGVTVVSTEMVLFEWLNRAGTAEFKDVSQWVK